MTDSSPFTVFPAEMWAHIAHEGDLVAWAGLRASCKRLWRLLNDWDRVAALAPVDRAELVGLVPTSVLDRTDRRRWEQLDLAEDRSIDYRLAHRAARPAAGGQG